VKKTFRLIGMGVLTGITLLLTGSVLSAKTIIKVATSTNPSHIYNLSMNHFADMVREKSEGELEVQVFPSAQLGSERDTVEGLQLGTLEMTLTSTGPMGSFLPDIKVFNLPFLFNNRDEAYQILDGPVGSAIGDKLPKIGIRSLGWFENGFRHITNSVRPIHVPADLKGLKLRVMEDNVFISTMKALGASPLPMAFGEVYTALEQKTIDGQENPLAVLDSNRINEVQKYLALTGHFYSPALLLVCEKFFQSLPRNHQDVLQFCAEKAKAFERKLSLEADQNLEAKLAGSGMAITHPDKAPFVTAVKKVYDDPQIARQIGDGNEKKGAEIIQGVLKALGR
jgi:tripartite ATP-independent transporter DctP family solute receptor